MAINKPSGLLSNPGMAEATKDCALSRLQTRFDELYLVHRLDCDTSGILVFAKHKKAEGALKKQFQLREVSKTYIAQVWGHPKSEGVIREPLAKNPDDIPLQKVDPAGKEAITRYQVMDSLVSEGSSLISLHPETGRTHQLRVHMAHIGHPILGDTFYAPAGVQQAAGRLCLHATALTFRHFVTHSTVSLRCEADFSWLGL